jgi:hypothetical protein
MCKLKAIFFKSKFDKIRQKNHCPPLFVAFGDEVLGFSKSTFPKMLWAIHCDILHNFGMDFGDMGAHKIFIFLCKSRVYIVCNVFMIFKEMFKHFIIVSRNILSPSCCVDFHHYCRYWGFCLIFWQWIPLL